MFAALLCLIGLVHGSPTRIGTELPPMRSELSPPQATGIGPLVEETSDPSYHAARGCRALVQRSDDTENEGTWKRCPT